MSSSVFASSSQKLRFCIKSLSLLLICVLTGGFQSAPGQNPEAPFSIELVVPISTPNGHREISIEQYYNLHVLVKNISPHPQRLWKDWNTWGYFNLRLEWQAAGKTFPIVRKAPKVWNGDFPDYWVLEPGETVVLFIDMRSGDWEGFPDLYGERIPAKIKAIYENKRDVLADEFNLWYGKLETPLIDVIFK